MFVQNIIKVSAAAHELSCARRKKTWTKTIESVATTRRSTESRTCVVARTYSSFGDRAFAAAGPILWNSLPSHLKDVADLLCGR